MNIGSQGLLFFPVKAMRSVHQNWPYNIRKSKKGHILCFDLKWLQSFSVVVFVVFVVFVVVVVGSGVVVVIYLLLSQTKSMQNDFKERDVWLEMEALKQTNKQTAKRFTARSPKVWTPLGNSHSFMQTLTNQNSRTASSWLLIGFNLYERMWKNRKRSHFWAPCCNKACDIRSYS